MGRKSIYTAVIGCGMISDIYLKNMTERFENLEVVACCDLDPERLQAKRRRIISEVVRWKRSWRTPGWSL